MLAARFHKRFGVPPLTAGIVITAALASHGLLDMMSNPVGGRLSGPLSSARLYVDWRPIHSVPIDLRQLTGVAMVRVRSEM
jgi:hypothetical protein